jgi:hypothetical protein
MADINPDGSKADDSQLRERPSVKPLHLDNPGDAKQKVLELNKQEEKDGKDEDKKKTYGRVPDGTGKLPSMRTTLEISDVLPNVNFLLTQPRQFSSCPRLTTWSRSSFRLRNPRTCPI